MRQRAWILLVNDSYIACAPEELCFGVYETKRDAESARARYRAKGHQQKMEVVRCEVRLAVK